jgi:hypothetical protein
MGDEQASPIPPAGKPLDGNTDVQRARSLTSVPGVSPDKELIKLNIAFSVLKYVIFGTGIIMLASLAADIFLARTVFTGQAPDIVDHVSRIGALTIPLVSFILGHIFGKSQD